MGVASGRDRNRHIHPGNRRANRMPTQPKDFPLPTDYDVENPREDAEYAITLLKSVIDWHPDLTDTYRQGLVTAIRILERLAD